MYKTQYHLSIFWLWLRYFYLVPAISVIGQISRCSMNIVQISPSQKTFVMIVKFHFRRCPNEHLTLSMFQTFLMTSFSIGNIEISFLVITRNCNFMKGAFAVICRIFRDQGITSISSLNGQRIFSSNPCFPHIRAIP